MPAITRRTFLSASASSLALMACRDLLDDSPRVLPRPLESGIRHVVVVMMENRSFDHFLGWLPGADGMQAGLAYEDARGAPHFTYPLAPDYQGCRYQNPDHSYQGGRVEYDGGACDGWLRVNDLFSIGYYTQPDLAFLGRAAPYWTVCDRYFSPIMAPTYPNRLYMHAGVTDRLDNALAPSALPTIWDRLAAAGLRGRYYASDLPFTALWGTKYIGITRPYVEFLFDCALGNLPEVAFVDPPFLGESSGTSSDDEPYGDIRAGEAFLARTYEAVRRSPQWRSTVLVITFDEWGGFFDHVAPETAPDVYPALQLRGFRVPCVVISPYARRGHVASGTYDHTSILKMIEWRWGLPPLSVRDAAANNLAEVLDLAAPDLQAPALPVAPFLATSCRAPFGGV
jgi:phospholipase C